MTANAAFADAEKIIGGAIRAGVSGSRVYSSIPTNPTYPLMVVARIGGLPLHRNAVDQAELQVDVWAESKSEARQLADDARVALMTIEGTTVTVGSSSAIVYDITPTLGLSWLPDPTNSTKDRYVFGVRATLRAV